MFASKNGLSKNKMVTNAFINIKYKLFNSNYSFTGKHNSKNFELGYCKTLYNSTIFATNERRQISIKNIFYSIPQHKFSKKPKIEKKTFLINQNSDSPIDSPNQNSETNIEEKDVNSNDNIYLKIYSCLNRVEALEPSDPLREKIEAFMTQNKISLEEYKSQEDLFKLISTDKDKIEEIDSYLEKLIKEEISEEEFAQENDNQIRFVRPPHNIHELKKVFTEAEEIYEKNKKYLFHNDKGVKRDIKDTFLEKVPPYFQMRALSFPETQSDIFLIGVQRNSDVHALYLSNILENYKPDMIGVHMSPDLPMFLNCTENYKEAWKSFVAGKSNYNYLVNPLPQSVNQILLTPRKIEHMIDNTFAASEDISISPKIVFSEQRVLNVRNSNKTFADCFLSPFIYSFNNRTDVDNYPPIAICDLPHLKILEDVVYTTHIDTLKDVLHKVLEELTIHNYGFSFEAFYPEIFLNRRLDYTAEVVKHLSNSSKRIALVMPHNYIEPMIESWKKLDKEYKKLNSFFRENNEDIYFVDFVEKLVIVDLLYGSFIHNNFIKKNSFPYAKRRELDSWRNMWTNVIMLWQHYYNHYSDIIANVPFNEGIYNAHLKKFNLVESEERDQQIEENELKEEYMSNLNK